MNTMAEDQNRIRLGRIITFIGAAWIGLFFLARSGLFGSNQFTTVILGMGAFFPIAMMFVGRVVRRRSTRTSAESEEPSPPAPRPPPRSVTQRPNRPPDPVTIEELSAAVKFEEVEDGVEPIAMPEDLATPSDTKTSAEMVAEAKKRLSG